MNKVASYTVNNRIAQLCNVNILLLNFVIAASAHIHLGDREKIFNQTGKPAGLIDNDINSIVSVIVAHENPVFKTFRITLNRHKRSSQLM